MKKGNDEGVIEFEQRFTSLSYHVPYLIPDERTRIDMFVGALGGVYADKMVGGIYLTFLDAVTAAMAIETRRTFTGSGSSGGSGSGSRGRFGGRFRRPSRSQLGRQQAGQFSAGGSSQGGSSGGQAFSFGQQQSSGCFECGGLDHFRRDCPFLAQRTAPSQQGGQFSARGSSGV
ncbi:hypothetical protein ACLB2K_007546 [Fragaria x ananassa]